MEKNRGPPEPVILEPSCTPRIGCPDSLARQLRPDRAGGQPERRASRAGHGQQRMDFSLSRERPPDRASRKEARAHLSGSRAVAGLRGCTLWSSGQPSESL